MVVFGPWKGYEDSFDGSSDRYPFFRAQVEEARQYHSDMKILAYLRTSLKVLKAFESVRAVRLSGSSLDDILTVLRKHFGNPKGIVRNVTDSLFSRRVKNYEPAELAKYSVEVDNALAVLKAIGYEHKLDNIDTMDKLVSKLSSNDVDRWGEFGRRKESEGEIINFPLFAHFLSNLVEDRRFAALSAFDINSRSKDQNPIKTKKSDDHIQEGVLSGDWWHQVQVFLLPGDSFYTQVSKVFAFGRLQSKKVGEESQSMWALLVDMA